MDEAFLPLSVASSPCKRTARTWDHAQGAATAVLCAARLADHRGCGLWPCPANGVGGIATVGKYRCSPLPGLLLEVVTQSDSQGFTPRRPMNTKPTCTSVTSRLRVRPSHAFQSWRKTPHDLSSGAEDAKSGMTRCSRRVRIHSLTSNSSGHAPDGQPPERLPLRQAPSHPRSR